MGRSRVLIEAGALMCCISDIWTGCLLQEIELNNDCYVVESLIKRKSVSLTSNNLIVKDWHLSWRRFIGEIDITDDTVNYMWLRQSYLAIFLILNVDSEVIFYISLVFNV